MRMSVVTEAFAADPLDVFMRTSVDVVHDQPKSSLQGIVPAPAPSRGDAIVPRGSPLKRLAPRSRWEGSSERRTPEGVGLSSCPRRQKDDAHRQGDARNGGHSSPAYWTNRSLANRQVRWVHPSERSVPASGRGDPRVMIHSNDISGIVATVIADRQVCLL
jgi:hypothetical protein